MSDSGISVVSSQNSTVLLASSEPSLFRIPNSFPPKFVSSKPDVPIASKTDAVQAVHNSVVMAHQVSVTLLIVFLCRALVTDCSYLKACVGSFHLWIKCVERGWFSQVEFSAVFEFFSVI